MIRSMRLKTQKAKKDNKPNSFFKSAAFPIVVVVVLALFLTSLVETSEASKRHHRHHAPGCRTHKCDVWAYGEWLKHEPFTGYVVEGRVSTFGYLTGDSEGQTADQGSTARPCIAIRNDATLDHLFLVTVEGHTAKLIQCDWGPAESTGRSIDITGLGDQKLGLSPSSFPTDSWGVAKELR